MAAARLNTRDEASLSTATLAALEPVRYNGQLAEVYLQFASSEAALRAYLSMERALAEGCLSAVEIEAVKLLVSELTQCQYCLAVHSMKSRQAGISATTQIALRSAGRTGDARVDALLDIVRHFFKQPGPISDDLLNQARAEGISDQALVDLTMAVTTIFFTNITNHINDTPVTLPAPPALQDS